MGPQPIDGLIRQELKQDRDRDLDWDQEEWVTVYYAEHFTLQLIWEIKQDQYFGIVSVPVPLPFPYKFCLIRLSA